MDEVAVDEILKGKLRIYQKKKGYRFSIDTLLLVSFISLKSKEKAIDLGTGSGIIPIILASSFPQTHWTGLEIQSDLAKMARQSVELNNLQDRVEIIHGDAGEIQNICPARAFDVVVFNPPYRKIKSGRKNPNPEKAIARHEIKGSLELFLRAAAFLLKPGGKIFAIYPACRLVELASLFRKNFLEPKKMKFVFSQSECDAKFVLVEGRAGAGEELKVEAPLIIYDENNNYTGQVKEIFKSLAAAADGGN